CSNSARKLITQSSSILRRYVSSRRSPTHCARGSSSKKCPSSAFAAGSRTSTSSSKLCCPVLLQPPAFRLTLCLAPITAPHHVRFHLIITSCFPQVLRRENRQSPVVGEALSLPCPTFCCGR